jgi:hypothetical protein
MNADNMTNDELIRAIEDEGSPFALALIARLDGLQSELDEARAEIVDLENGPLCSDCDHTDFVVYKSFFGSCVEIVGLNAGWLKKREVADQLLDQIKEAFPS